MPITHYQKPPGVQASEIVMITPHDSGMGFVVLHLADDRTIIWDDAKPRVGEICVSGCGVKTKILTKADFESNYQACDPDLRPQFHPMPPADVIDAANLVSRYFAKQNITEWELGDCKARFPLDARPKTGLTSRERVALHLKDVEEQRSMFEAMIISEHGSVFRGPLGRYGDNRIQSTWEVWMACIEANQLREARA